MTFFRSVTARLVGVVAAFALATVALAAEPPIFTPSGSGVAVSGYDAVAYMTEGRPRRGNPAITAKHAGVTWQFASPENRALFIANPEMYAPQYGGYCAYAVSQGYTAKADPEAWSVVGGRLYLNYDLSIRDRWDRNRDGYIRDANANWPRVLGK